MFNIIDETFGTIIILLTDTEIVFIVKTDMLTIISTDAMIFEDECNRMIDF